MKNLGTLYGYEVKKLLKWKPAWVVTVVLTVLMIYTAWPKSNGSGAIFSLTDPDGNTVSQFLTGSEQNEQTREGARRISGQAMDETFFQNLRAASTGNGRYVLREHWDQVCYFYLIDNSYLGPYSLLTEEMGLDPATATAEQFYQARQEKIDMQLVGLTDEERGYWRDMENRVEKPFVYQYSEGYQEFLNNVYGLSNVIPLLAGVCLCALFSEEKRTRSDSLIFTSRRSRLPQYLAKVLAGMTVAVAAALLVIGVTAAVVLLNWGWDGFDAAIQLWYLISGVPLTMTQLRKLQTLAEQLKSSKLRWYEKYTNGDISKPEYLKFKADVDKKLAENEEAQREAESRMEQLDSERTCSDERLDAACRDFQKSRQITYELAHAFIKAIYVYPDERVEIEWKFKDPFVK